MKHAELIVGIYHRHGFYKNGSTRRRGIVNETLEIVFALCLYGNNVTAVAHGNDVILQNFGVGAADIVLQGLLDAVVGLADLTANFGKLAARFIGNHILGNNRARNAILKVSVGEQTTKDLVQRCFKGSICLGILAYLTCRAQKATDVENFAHRKHRSLDRALASIGDVDDRAKGRHALGFEKAARICCAALSAQDLYGIHRGGQSARHCLRARGGCTVGKHFANLIKFKSCECFLCKIHTLFSLCGMGARIV